MAITGLLLVIAGLVVWFAGDRLSWIGHLPGDIRIERCISSEDDIAVLNADSHYGYGHPIGVAMAGPGIFDPYID